MYVTKYSNKKQISRQVFASAYFTRATHAKVNYQNTAMQTDSVNYQCVYNQSTLSKHVIIICCSTTTSNYMQIAVLGLNQGLQWDGMDRHGIPALPWLTGNHTSTSFRRKVTPVCFGGHFVRFRQLVIE